MKTRAFAWIRSTPYLAGLPRDVAVLSVVAFCVALGFGILSPALPVYARTFGVSAFAVSAVISAFAFMRFVTAPGAGSMVNRLGERRVLSVGIWMVAISSLLAGLAQDYVQLLVLRGIGGIGSAMFTVSAMALLLRSVGMAQRGRAAGAFQAGFLFGGITGPVIGGAVTGISLRAPFFVYAATLAVAGLVGSRFLSKAPQSASSPDGPPAETGEDAETPPASRDGELPAQHTGFSGALRHSAYRAALAANLSNGFIAFGLRASLVPLYVVEGLGRDVFLVSIGFLLSAVAQALALIPAGRVTDNRGRKPAMIMGAAAVVAGMATLTLPSGAIGFLLAMTLLGLGGAFLGASPSAVVGDVSGGASRGSAGAGRRGGAGAVSAYQMTGDLGAILGPLAAGALKDAFGFQAAFGIGLAVAAGSLLVSLLMRETLTTRPDSAHR